jgi:hypothetical protein
MTIIHGTYRGGCVLLDDPVSWTEGLRVSVAAEPDFIGMSEADWPTDVESLAKLLERIDSFDPVELSAADEAEIEAARNTVREKSLAAVRDQMGLTS